MYIQQIRTSLGTGQYISLATYHSTMYSDLNKSIYLPVYHIEKCAHDQVHIDAIYEEFVDNVHSEMKAFLKKFDCTERPAKSLNHIGMMS